MTAAIDIIQEALEGIGEYSPGESITDADVERSKTVLNDMLDQWSNESLACYAFKTQSILLQNNKSRYTIGPSVLADINSERPLRLEQMFLTDALGNTYPVNLVTQYDFNLIGNRMVTSQIPCVAWYDPQDPIAAINVFPVPVQPLYTLYFTSYLQLTEFPDLVTQIDFPTGYVRMIKTNLMLALCPYFGKMVPPDIRAIAEESRGSVKRKNIINQPSRFDRELTVRGTGSWNILAGDWNNRGS
jgi:hypothetical protein